RFSEGVFGLFPGMDLLHGGHAAKALLLEGRTDDERLPIFEEEDGGQPLAAVEIDAREVKEVRGGSRDEAVRAERPQTLADRFEPCSVDLFVQNHRGHPSSRRRTQFLHPRMDDAGEVLLHVFLDFGSKKRFRLQLPRRKTAMISKVWQRIFQWPLSCTLPG